MEKNKTGRYFKYAIGEIVLVVIGILIALQINNWSEYRKDRVAERRLLVNIQKDIVQDTLDIGWNKSVHEKALHNELLLLRLLNEDPNVEADSINYLDALSVKMISTLHNSSFKNLSNNNPDLISNEVLKQKINRQYDFFYTSLLEVQNNQPEYNLYAKLLPYFKKHFVHEGRVIEFEQSANGNQEFFDYKYDRSALEPFNIAEMQSDREFAIELSEVIFLRSAVLSVYDETLSRIRILYHDIEDELNKN